MYMVLYTCSREVAEQISQTIVREHLASCATVIDGVRRFSAVKGVPSSEAAALLAFFTTIERFGELSQALEAMDPSGSGAVVALAVTGGNAAFVQKTEG